MDDKPERIENIVTFRFKNLLVAFLPGPNLH